VLRARRAQRPQAAASDAEKEISSTSLQVHQHCGRQSRGVRIDESTATAVVRAMPWPSPRRCNTWWMDHGDRPLADGRPSVRRTAARVVLLTDEDAVLLISARDPGVAAAPEFWFTPGGGLEPGETLEDAARREIHEEVGHSLSDLGPVVWERSTTFPFDGSTVVQTESFFVVRTARFDARQMAWTDLESRSTTGWRWWPLRELVGSDVPVYPPDLGELVVAWVREGPPALPRRIA
jgi:8-oxo-dGTP pyrophosphatase MutT (NUDIX family)